ncbi:MAG: hypothetical protein R2744_05270 [Bacteroidales bacterium]
MALMVFADPRVATQGYYIKALPGFAMPLMVFADSRVATRGYYIKTLPGLAWH